MWVPEGFEHQPLFSQPLLGTQGEAARQRRTLGRQPGREAAKGIMSAIPEEVECVDRPPLSGKDYNDHLISTIKSKIRKDLIV